ncbi:MAG: aminomethyl-transferring glycine dehydrogenase subunit GcvPA [Candidatus Zixiibacteriota bacterium]
MTYVPHSEDERHQLLRSIGVSRFEELLKGVPESVRLTDKLNLPAALSEFETLKILSSLAAKNHIGPEYANFMGCGAYDHYVPSIVGHLVDRSEFKTAYTPYQAEVAQGTLQVIYEFQSLICRLTGMEAANASLYDGGSATAEAVLLALNVTKRRKIVISSLVHPHYVDCVKIYLGGKDYEVVMVKHDKGNIDIENLRKQIKDAACFVFQNPNFYGYIEPTEQLPQIVKDAGALLIAVTSPISLAYLKAPSEYDADIAVGEGQALGNDLMFGGPYFGYFAITKQYLRQMPGRLTAMTKDKNGRRGYCLTLQTREQHIRRDKATSNICTNQALCALAGTIYMATLGKEGLKEVARLCVNKAHYLKDALTSIDGVALAYDKPFFMEFPLRMPEPARDVFDRLVARKIFAGVPTSRFLWDEDFLIVCATETRTKTEMDCYRHELKEVMVKDAVLP